MKSIVLNEVKKEIFDELSTLIKGSEVYGGVIADYNGSIYNGDIIINTCSLKTYKREMEFMNELVKIVNKVY